jgi:hypothetical protein
MSALLRLLTQAIKFVYRLATSSGLLDIAGHRNGRALAALGDIE